MSISAAEFLKWIQVFNLTEGGVTPGEVTLQAAYDGGNTINLAPSRPIAVNTSLGLQEAVIGDKGTQLHQPIYHLGTGQNLTLSTADVDIIYTNDQTTSGSNVIIIQDESSGAIYSDNSTFYVWDANVANSIIVEGMGIATVDGVSSITLTGGEGLKFSRIALNIWISEKLTINNNIFNGLVAGSGVTITQDSNRRSVISLSGSGASAASGYITRQNIQNSVAGEIHFLDTVSYFIPKCGNVIPDVNQCNNFQYILDGNQHLGLKYIGTASGTFEITFQLNVQYSSINTNAASNNYQLSANLNLTAGPGGSFAPVNIISGNNSGSNVPFIVFPNYATTTSIVFQISLNPNDVVYPNIRNDGPGNTAALNSIILNTFSAIGKKVEDTGGLSAGVASLNGITGNVSLISDSSVNITNSSSSEIQLSIGQYQVISGTSQILIQNGCYLLTNTSLTTVTLPITCSQGSFIKILGSGNGLFTILSNSGQTIISGITSTSSGGSMTSLDPNSGVVLVCTVANTIFTISEGEKGNFTFI